MPTDPADTPNAEPPQAPNDTLWTCCHCNKPLVGKSYSVRDGGMWCWDCSNAAQPTEAPEKGATVRMVAAAHGTRVVVPGYYSDPDCFRYVHGGWLSEEAGGSIMTDSDVLKVRCWLAKTLHALVAAQAEVTKWKTWAETVDRFRVDWQTDAFRLQGELAASQAEVERLQKTMKEIHALVEARAKQGEPYSYETTSQPLGIRGGIVHSRRGDLCDMRDAVQRIIRSAQSRTTTSIGDVEK